MLDLGFFDSIQSLKNTYSKNTVDKLVHVVHQSFDETSPEALEGTVLSMMKHMEAAMCVDGGTNFESPRKYNARRRKAGEDVSKIYCSPIIYQKAWAAFRSSSAQ